MALNASKVTSLPLNSHNKSQKTIMSKTTSIQWGENIIIADADYIDRVAFHLTVNFERMIGRHIPQADMAKWAECVALDGGCRKPENANTQSNEKTHVILVHENTREQMDNFNPGTFTAKEECDGKQLDAQAFSGPLGEFLFHCIPSNEQRDSLKKTDILSDLLAHMADEEQVKRIVIIPDLESDSNTINSLMPVIRHLDREHSEKRVTLLAMQPLSGLPCRTEILGYSLLAALGVKAEEIK